MSTPTVTAKPISARVGRGTITMARKVPARISPAEEITGPVSTSPRTAASATVAPPSSASRIRLVMKML